MMTRARASHYCDLSEAEFEREVGAGRLPSPITLGKKPHWSRKSLDEYLDRLHDGETPDWKQTSSFYRRRNAA